MLIATGEGDGRVWRCDMCSGLHTTVNAAKSRACKSNNNTKSSRRAFEIVAGLAKELETSSVDRSNAVTCLC